MIVRIWHGKTPRARADEYTAFLKEQAVPAIRDAEGNLEVSILRQDQKDASDFMVVTGWDSEDAIRAFAGDDFRRAKYYPEDKGFLLELEPQAQHYELVAKAP